MRERLRPAQARAPARRVIPGACPAWRSTRRHTALRSCLGACPVRRPALITLGTAFLIYYYTRAAASSRSTRSRNQIEDFQKASAPAIARVQRAAARLRDACVDGPGAALPAGRAGGRVRRRDVRLRRATSRCSTTSRSASRPARCWPARAHRQRQDDAHPPAAAPLRPDGGRDPPRRRRPARRPAGATCAGASAWSRRTCSCSTRTVRDNLTFFDPASPTSASGGAGRARPGRVVRALPQASTPMLGPAAAGCRRRGAAAGLRARLPARPRPGHPRRSVVAARPGHRAADRARGRPAAARAAPAIIIAHRLATVERADAILILEDGRHASSTARAPRWPPTPTRASPGCCAAGVEEVLA